MENPFFETDMALDSAEKMNLGEIAQNKRLENGIIKRSLRLENPDLAKKLGKPQGDYVTFDAEGGILDAETGGMLAHYISKTLSTMSAGLLTRGKDVLIVGLGNDGVLADALGARVVDKIKVTRNLIAEGARIKQSVCALSAGVYTVTGIQAAETVGAVIEKLKPSLVVIVDALATSSPRRLASSFQITNTGITPGSGVGRDRIRLDRNVLGVPVLALGVPMVISMRTALREFVDSYASKSGMTLDEAKLRALLDEKKFLTLAVAPKEIEIYLEKVSDIVSNAINLAYTGSPRK